MRNDIKSVFILSTINLISGNSAAAFRMKMYAKALVDDGWDVYFCCFPFHIPEPFNKKNRENTKHSLNDLQSGKELNIFKRFLAFFFYLTYIYRTYKLSERVEGKKKYLLYPNNTTSFDFAFFLLLKVIHQQDVYIEINELRRTLISNISIPKSFVMRWYIILTSARDWVKYYLSEFLVPFYNGVIVISTSLFDYFKKANANIIRVPVLVQTSTKQITNQVINNDSKFRICFSGFIARNKEGFENFFQALALLKEENFSFSVDLFGPTIPWEEKYLLEELPKTLGISEYITYHGVVQQKELYSIYQEYHLLVLPRGYSQQTKYGFATKLAEYLNSGVPVLVTNVGDNSLIIKDDYNGFVVEPDDPLAMKNKIVYIRSQYNSVVEQVSIKARETVRTQLDYTNYIQVLSQLFQR